MEGTTDLLPNSQSENEYTDETEGKGSRMLIALCGDRLYNLKAGGGLSTAPRGFFRFKLAVRLVNEHL